MKKGISLTLLIFCINLISAQTWLPLGNGLSTGSFDQTTDIVDYNGGLAVGGIFTGSGGVTSNNVIFWDGNSWQALGSGLGSNVECLAVYNGTLFAGLDVIGSNAIYKYNGASWSTSGSINQSVYTLYVDTEDNILYAGGSFTSPGTYVAQTNDGITWSGTGSGLSAGSQPFPAVYAIQKYKDHIYIGGTFNPTGMKFISKLDAGFWEPLNSLEPNNKVTTMMVFNDTLYVGGDFSYFWTGVNPKYYNVGVVKYDGSDWASLTYGQGPTDVEDITYYNGKIYATGSFTSVFSGPAANRIAAWDTISGWVALGSGLDHNGLSLHTLQDTLYVGGRFSLANGISNTSKIAKYYDPFRGCNDTNYFDFNPDVDEFLPGACKVLKVYGCTDPNYAEYDSTANIDNGSCATVINIVNGCTDPNYLEYDPNANTDDGSCQTLIVYGCTNSNYLEYDPNANVDDGSCATLGIQGCTDSNYVEYNPSANIDDGSCQTLIVYGCTDDNYLEYNSSANTDDGSCATLIVTGCTDPNYLEYDSLANVDDGSCQNLINGLDERSMNRFDINIFPNPSSGELALEVNPLSNKVLEISISSIIGNDIVKFKSNVTSNRRNRVSLSPYFKSLKLGSYIVKVQLGEELVYRIISRK